LNKEKKVEREKEEKKRDGRKKGSADADRKQGVTQQQRILEHGRNYNFQQ